MDEKEYEILKAKFLKMIANVPLPLREEIIAVVDDKPVSWNAASGEVKVDTKDAKIILKHLKDMGVL